MANMSINYPNETANFAMGAQTGMALGSAMDRKDSQVPNIPMNDPGEIPQVDINQLTQQEQADIAQYQELEKKSKGLDETAMYDVKRAAVNSSQSQIVKQAMLAGISAKELDMYLKDIQNKGINSPSAMALKGKLGGEGSAGWHAVQSKIAEIQGIQKKAVDDWSMKVKNALLDFDTVQTKINDYSYKGQISESTAKFLQNMPNYIPMLASTSEENKQWVMEYLKNRQERKQSAATADKSIVYRGYNTKTKSWESWRGYSPQEWIAQNPNMDKSTIQPSGKSGEFSVGEVIRENKDKPSPFKEGAKQKLKPLTESIRDKYLKENNNNPDKARKAAQDDGYDTSKVVK